MLTKKGSAILSELKGEVDSALEERTKEFIIRDIKNGINFLFFITTKFFRVLFYFLIVPLLVFVIFSDQSMMASIINAPIDTLVNNKDLYVTFTVVISFIMTFFIYIPRAIDNFKSTKAAAINDTKYLMEKNISQVELIEEVLHRHQLIDKKEQ